MQRLHFFVAARTNDLGIGKVVGYDASGKSAVVEYFDSPTTIQRKQFTYAVRDLEPLSSLDPQTRVYFYDQTSSIWKMGRIEHHIDDVCYIALPNKEQSTISQEEVFVRWNKPLASPIEHVKAGLTETPYFHERRCKLVSHLVRQRAVARGMTGLLSAPVFLERHQLNVVTKVLSDPVQRYLLADEVGLGKTIEAGMIIRQHLLDNADQHNVIVTVPSVLVEQWENELRFRCCVGDSFLHQVEVLSYEELLRRDDLSPDLLVVDEAHQVTQPEFKELYSRLCDLSKPSKCNKLLLLSATPVRGNEHGFLHLLHLLDPTIYKLDGIQEFRDRVAKRQDLANLFVTLAEGQDNYFLEQAVTDASSLFPGDTRLQTIANELLTVLAHADNEDQQTSQSKNHLIHVLRGYLGDTYRLDRRLLRNRRSGFIEGLLPGRAGLQKGDCSELREQKSEEFIELWRERAARMCVDCDPSTGVDWTPMAAELFCGFLEAAWTSSAQLIALIENRKAFICSPPKKATVVGKVPVNKTFPPFEGELALLDEILSQADAVDGDFDSMLDAVCQVAISKVKSFDRVVVMCSDAGTGDTIFRRLNIRSTAPIVRFLPNEATAPEWIKNGILVCDRRAEEGLNLQGGKVCLVHADLPLSPNRIEQRIGRLDRIGVGRAVPSVAIAPPTSAYLSKWLAVLENGWQVFSRSIASLQYLVGDEMHNLRIQLLKEGASAFDEATASLGGDDGRIRKEVRAIQNQDELDALGSTDSSTDELLEGIETYEKSADEFTQAMNLWVLEVLNFIRVGEKEPNDRVWRYHYRSTERGQQTLVARSDFLRWFEKATDSEADHSAFRPPLTWPMTSNRETARHRRVGVARLGHSWVDSLHSYLRWDDRGTCAALWRWQPNSAATNELYFRFTAIVEADRDVLDDWSKQKAWTNAYTVARIADSVFPPLLVDLWLDRDQLKPSNERVRSLSRPYDKRAGDVNISGVKWNEIFRRLEMSSQEWADRCGSICIAAERLIVEEHDVAGILQTKLAAHDRDHRRVTELLANRLKVISPHSPEHLQIQRDLEQANETHGAIRESIRSARVRFDSVTVSILSNERFA